MCLVISTRLNLTLLVLETKVRANTWIMIFSDTGYPVYYSNIQATKSFHGNMLNLDRIRKSSQDKAGCQIKGNLLANKEKLKIADMRTSFLFLFLLICLNFQISSHSDEYLFQDVFKQNKSIHTIDVSHQRSHFPFAANGGKNET